MDIKKVAAAAVASLALIASSAGAAVNATVGPTSLVTAPTLVGASSPQVGLFSFTLNQDAGETLSSVAVTLNNVGTSVATGADLASVSVYKDDGDGIFNSATDLLAGSQTTVNVGSATTVTTAANNTIAAAGSKFFVSVATGATFSGNSPADSLTATLAANGIVTSANSPTVTAATTDMLVADTAAPTLSTAMAKNTGGTSAKEAGDSIDLVFSESTNKPAITAANIGTVLTLNNSHSFLDGAGALGSATWSVDGKTLTIVLSAGTSLPTVTVGDTVTVAGSTIKDLAGNNASGAQAITGSFTQSTTGDGDGGDDEGDHHVCGNTLMNGRLYMVGSEATVYLAAGCRLKPFRGAAVFHARGMKFQNIIKLAALPTGVTISDKPVLPAAGTLIKGKAKTVWFVDSEGHLRAFVSADVFTKLGFKFDQVQTISDSDLSTMPTSTNNISDSTQHPDGALVKCTASPAVFEIVGKMRFPFANAEAFESKGHSFAHVLVVDCGQFHYTQGAPVSN